MCINAHFNIYDSQQPADLGNIMMPIDWWENQMPESQAYRIHMRDLKPAQLFLHHRHCIILLSCMGFSGAIF